MQKTYADGEAFFYRGEPFALRCVAETTTPSVEVRGGTLCVAASGPIEVRRRLLYWYTSETEAVIHALLPAWAKRLALRPRSAQVRYAKTRWGSCSSSGSLSFNSRIAMLTDDVAEYIVVHELCHLKQMNHGPAFWDEMECALPGSRALRRKLREQEKNAQL